MIETIEEKNKSMNEKVFWYKFPGALFNHLTSTEYHLKEHAKTVNTLADRTEPTNR